MGFIPGVSCGEECQGGLAAPFNTMTSFSVTLGDRHQMLGYWFPETSELGGSPSGSSQKRWTARWLDVQILGFSVMSCA